MRDALATLCASAAAAGALALFHQAEARRAERRHPPRGRFLEVDGVRLHYVETGQGPPVVLIHGAGSMIREWQMSGLVPLLARQHRVIIFDRPGYGWSTRPRDRAWSAAAQAAVLAKALCRLDAKHPLLVGHSWGALVAAEMALLRDVAPRGLALLSGVLFPGWRPDVAAAWPLSVPLVGPVLCYTVGPLLGRTLQAGILRRLFDPLRVPAGFDSFPTSMALRPEQLRANAEDAAQTLPSAAALSGRYKDISGAVLITIGQRDRVAETAQARRLHDILPGSTLRIVPGVGHMIHHAVPAMVAEEIGRLEALTPPLA